MMKHVKITSIILVLLIITTLSGCRQDIIENNEMFPDLNFSIHSYDKLAFDSEGHFKILQFTDLHLTYGFDFNDRETFRLIKLATLQEQPDLVVFTGDQTMSPMNRRLYDRLTRWMNQLDVPWTFVFGNHDDEANASKVELASLVLNKANNVLFRMGPNNITGVGNFLIHLIDPSTEDLTFTLYFIDSNAHRTYEIDGTKKFWYDYIYADQINWYEAMVNLVTSEAGSTLPSIAFFHIPLPEYNDVLDQPSLIETGVRLELPCTPYINTGMFSKMVELGSTKGVFVGHDHINDYTYTKDGIMLGYGRATGFNAYGHKDLDKGARVIHINIDGTFTTNTITTKDIGGW
jgi:hypothetical protein